MSYIALEHLSTSLSPGSGTWNIHLERVTSRVTPINCHQQRNDQLKGTSRLKFPQLRNHSGTGCPHNGQKKEEAPEAFLRAHALVSDKYHRSPRPFRILQRVRCARQPLPPSHLPVLPTGPLFTTIPPDPTTRDLKIATKAHHRPARFPRSHQCAATGRPPRCHHSRRAESVFSDSRFGAPERLSGFHPVPIAVGHRQHRHGADFSSL